MDIVKKNLLSIIFGVIALLAIAADFYPMAGKRDALKTEAAAHAAKAEALKQLRDKPRTLPAVKPGSSESDPLPSFPTAQMVEEGHKKTDLVNKAADAVMARASGELNKHLPLVAGALPGSPGETLPASSFAREYVGMFPVQLAPGAVAAAVPPPAPRRAGAPPTLMQMLQAKVPPSDLELAAARVEKQKQVEAEVTRYSANGQPNNLPEVQDAVAAAFKSLAETLRTQTAQTAKVYVDPAAFSMYPGMIIGAAPTPTDIFWAQIGLWTQEDICHAIADINDANNPKTSVIDAPIKQLVKISFLSSASAQAAATAGAVPVFLVPGLAPGTGVGLGNNMDMPAAPVGDPAAPGAVAAVVPMDPAAAITKNTVASPTGRSSNGLYDVEHFSVELIVDAAKVPEVLEGLGSKRYISVIQVESIEPIDSAFYRGAGYYFGVKPCVRVRARCEQLFFRSWLGEFVPTRLKTILGYPAETAAA